jgi:hypothetical protein
MAQHTCCAPQAAQVPGPSPQAVLLDMGHYLWSAAANPSDPMCGTTLHLMQVLAPGLAPRARLFPWPLPAAAGPGCSWEQATPGFMDAPGEPLAAAAAWATCSMACTLGTCLQPPAANMRCSAVTARHERLRCRQSRALRALPGGIARHGSQPGAEQMLQSLLHNCLPGPVSTKCCCAAPPPLQAPALWCSPP